MTRSAESVVAGPSVNGGPSRVTLYTPEQFRGFPYLAQLREVINDSFDAANVDFFKVERLISKEQYLDILGDDTFTFILLSEPTDDGIEPTIYAVGSAHAYHGSLSASEGQDIWGYARPDHVDLSEVEEWELKILAVNKVAPRQGLGKYMLKLLEDECKRRFEANHRKDMAQGKGPQLCKVIITTVKEINQPFYERHGYCMDSKIFIDKGFHSMQNWQEFHVASMSKVL